MAEYTELELKTFELSSGDSNMSLSATSLALISNKPFPQHSSEELCRLIQAKQLWLVSPGLCRIQIAIDQNQFPSLTNETEVGFLEYLADVICQCPLWTTLGLIIKQEDIQHQPLYDGAPNLYFIIEHPNKSSVLLSPPHIPTARFDGVECLFRYQHGNSREVYTDTKHPGVDIDDHTPELGPQTQVPGLIHDLYRHEWSSDILPDFVMDITTENTRRQWENAAHLVQMALYVIIGTKKRMRGLRLFQLDTRPSLLELAPAIWNAHHLQAVTTHSNNFHIISSILAASTQAQSPSLRQKSMKLQISNAHGNNPLDNTEAEIDITLLRDSIQQRLWDLVRTTLKSTIPTKNVNMNAYAQRGETADEVLDLILVEADYFDEFGSDDIVFRNGLNKNWPLRHLSGSQIDDDDDDERDAEEYQQRFENENIECIDEKFCLEYADLLEETPNRMLGFGVQGNFSTSPFEELYYNPPTIQQHSFDELGDHDDDLGRSDYIYDVDTNYDTINEYLLIPETEGGMKTGQSTHGYSDDYMMEVDGDVMYELGRENKGAFHGSRNV